MEKTLNSSISSRLQLLQEFDLASSTTLFSQQTLCAVLDCSEATVERNRWAGIGVPFYKIGRSVKYKKSDILAYLENQNLHYSTVKVNEGHNEA